MFRCVCVGRGVQSHSVGLRPLVDVRLMFVIFVLVTYRLFDRTDAQLLSETCIIITSQPVSILNSTTLPFTFSMYISGGTVVPCTEYIDSDSKSYVAFSTTLCTFLRPRSHDLCLCFSWPFFCRYAAKHTLAKFFVLWQKLHSTALKRHSSDL